MANKAGRPGPPTPWSAKPLIDPTAIMTKAGQPTRSASESDSASDSEDEDDDDDEEEIEEDEYGAELTPALDAAILRTLAKIRSKTGVYAGERVLDEELKEAEEKAREAGVKGGVVRRSEGKKYTLADHHRAALLNGSDPSSLADDEETRLERPSSTSLSRTQDSGYGNMHMHADRQPLTHVQSQAQLRSEAVSAFNALTGDDDDDDDSDDEAGSGDLEERVDGLLVKRQKGGDEVEEDEEDYRKFLIDMGGGEEAVRKILGMGDQPIPRVAIDAENEEGQSDDGEEGGGKKVGGISKDEKRSRRKAKEEKKKEVKAKQDDDFLMNYILNRGWIDRTGEHVPTYDEIVGKPVEEEVEDEAGMTEDQNNAAGPSHPWGTLEDEDDFDEKAEQFETAYNFRFEEPGSSNIVSHPREIPSLVRRPDDTRASKRAAKAERKAAQQAAKEESIKREKGQKRREMEKQMGALKRDLGLEGDEEGIDWDELEKVLEGDFDEGEWERVVGKMLESRRYEDDDPAEEEEEVVDDEKPTWDDDLAEGYEEVGDDEVEQHVAFGGGLGEDDDDDAPINMDADFVEEQPKKKRKKDKSKKGKQRAEAAEEAADEMQVEEGVSAVDRVKKVKKAMEEYKALDHEDMIGDLPTRFKYTQSKPTSFGLTPVEILLATDAELNSIVGISHIAPYRRSGLGMQGRGLAKRVTDLRGKLGKRKWGEEVNEDEEGEDEVRVRDAGWGKKGASNVGTGSGLGSGTTPSGSGKGKSTTGTDEDKDAERGDAKRPGKRPGAKERKRLKIAQAQQMGMTVQEMDDKRRAEGNTNRFEPIADGSGSASPQKDADQEMVPGHAARIPSDAVTVPTATATETTEDGGKKKRRKKKHGQGWSELIPAEAGQLQMYD